MEPSSSYIPNLHLQSSAVDFIDTRAEQYHAAFAVPPSRYDPAIGGFVVCVPSPNLAMTQPTHAGASPSPADTSVTANDPPPPRPLAEPAAALRFWDSLFFQAMDQFALVEHPVEPPALVKLNFRIRDQRDWSGVFDQLERAKQEYSNVEKGFKAGFRRVYRSMADKVQPLIGVANLVPDVDYITPVLGAVQVLLEAAKKAASVREAMLGSFDDIDMMFSQVELFLQIFEGDENITRASVNLIAATFHAVESVMMFFLKSNWKKGLSATFKGEEYQQEITESLENMRSLSKTLINEAENSHKFEVSNAMSEVLTRTANWLTECEEIRQKQEVIHHDLKNGFKRLLDEYEANRLAHEAHRRETQMQFRASQERDFFLMAALRDAISSRAPSPIPQADLAAVPQCISPQALLDWIDIPDLATQDMAYIEERRKVRVPAHEQARAEQLIRTRQIKEWLASPSSTQLLVHGNYRGKRHMSGLSLFCLTLAQSLAGRAPRFLHLVFFCGLHTDSFTDDHTGGRAIIQSFICQLLCQYDFDGTLLANEVSEGLIQLGEVGELCDLFEMLVHRLPSVVLLCMIDGIVYYEREEFEEDMELVLVTLLKLSNEQNTRAAVKVLITSPTKTTDVRQPFPDELVLSMGAMAGAGNMAPSRGRLVRELSEGYDGVES
ncbi:hypothetical protein B0T25DRAFT_128413 [Lasiosphaeria hispida]|uniref:Fungal STAND N-terminal Goodbye domain-containing protein n=1 Tax=Lasiosphaeria hispida TaxID=260671 RepID=A0AAJ0MIH9_9PEZI|nr:hypothetical protein B0T25DRAFT_128413 [Lasiosphaeria hispida]